MVGVAACGTVTSIKALWETRIRKIQEEEKEEESRRKSKAGLPRRSEVKLFLLVTQRFKQRDDDDDEGPLLSLDFGQHQSQMW